MGNNCQDIYAKQRLGGNADHALDGRMRGPMFACRDHGGWPPAVLRHSTALEEQVRARADGGGAIDAD